MALAAANCSQAGLSPIPTKAGTKQASIRWEPFQTKRMTSAEISRLFVKGCNVALVGGGVSGNLECLDFDKPDLFKPYLDTLESVNPELRAKLRVWQETPSGGYHILFRCAGRVPGNTKLAMSPRRKDERGKMIQDVYIETRGEGGYFLVHPSTVAGKPYTLHGRWNELPVVTSAELDLLHGIARSFDESGQNDSHEPIRTDSNAGDRPGDKFNRENDWSQLLEAEGWQYIRTVGDRHHWCRPGKSDGSSSAPLNTQGLFCFSSSTPLPVQKPLDKFAFYTYYRFNGDFAAAARSLSEFRTVPDSSGQLRTFRTKPDVSGRPRTLSGRVADARRTTAGQIPDPLPRGSGLH